MNAMKITTDLVVEEDRKVGLKVNTRKTEVMKMRSSDTHCIRIDNTDINEVPKVTYLRCEISRDANVRNEINIRIGKAGAAFIMLNNVWRAHNMSLSTKLTLFNSIVVSVLIYGCESWK